MKEINISIPIKFNVAAIIHTIKNNSNCKVIDTLVQNEENILTIKADKEVDYFNCGMIISLILNYDKNKKLSGVYYQEVKYLNRDEIIKELY